MDIGVNRSNILTDDPPAREPMPSDLLDVPQASGGMLSEYEDELPIYLSLLKDFPPTTSYDLPEDELRHIPEGNKDSAWQHCLNSVGKYDRELCQTYREQIDALLVFAGLFSAVVTAFAVESYQWLQDDPLDASVELLRGMVALLSQNLNVTAPLTPPAPSPISGAAVARINAFWFVSLSLSLSAALVGILCKQWLREFERDIGQSPKKALAIRHIRLRGLEYWSVGSIVMSVPLIMQVALALFMIGIIELLWRLHAFVACCVTVVAGLTLVFFLATTFLPSIQYAYICIRCCIHPRQPWKYATKHAFTQPQCAFKSPQSWFVFRIFRPAIDHLFRVYGPDFSFRRPPLSTTLVLPPADSWVTFDMNWMKCHEHLILGPRCAFRSLAWIAKNLGEMHLSSSIWHCVWSHWLRNRDSRSPIAIARMDIATVADSYPRTGALSINIPQRTRAQARLFQCSLRTDLPVETAIELFLRVAPTIGVDSPWTREALHGIVNTYQDVSIQISDGLAIRLFRVAEMQTHTLVLPPDGPNIATRLNAAHSFNSILSLIYRGSRLHSSLLPAMSGLALQWLRANHPLPVALAARTVFEQTIRHLGTRAYYDDDWKRYPGIILVAKLAALVTQLWPTFVRQRHLVDQPHQPPILRELLALLSEGPRGPGQADSCRVTLPRRGSACNVDGEHSHLPAVEVQLVGHDSGGNVLNDPPGTISSPHLCIQVHEHAEMGVGTVGLDVSTSIPPTDSSQSVRHPASPPGSPISYNSPRPTYGSP